MGVIEQITQMRNQGMGDEEISDKLQEKRVPPASINEAFNQLKVKEAVSAENNSLQPPSPYPAQNKMPNQKQFYTPRTKQIEGPSSEQNNFQLENPDMQQDYYNPGEYPQQNQQNYQQMQPPQPQEEYYPQYNYEEYSPQAGMSGVTNTDTIIEVAEQVFSEKTKNFQKQMEMLSEFATLAESKIENNTERIRRMEKIIDNLQIKILDKVGTYGENLNNVKKEMSMMQESFSKVLPELAEAKSSEHKKHKK